MNPKNPSAMIFNHACRLILTQCEARIAPRSHEGADERRIYNRSATTTTSQYAGDGVRLQPQIPHNVRNASVTHDPMPEHLSAQHHACTLAELLCRTLGLVSHSLLGRLQAAEVCARHRSTHVHARVLTSEVDPSEGLLHLGIIQLSAA